MRGAEIDAGLDRHAGMVRVRRSGEETAICGFVETPFEDIIADDFWRGGRDVGREIEDAETAGAAAVFVFAAGAENVAAGVADFGVGL